MRSFRITIALACLTSIDQGRSAHAPADGLMVDTVDQGKSLNELASLLLASNNGKSLNELASLLLAFNHVAHPAYARQRAVNQRRSVRAPVTSMMAKEGRRRRTEAVSEEEREEAYYRNWFWDKAEEAIGKRFASARPDELKRIREFIKANRESEPKLPKRLRNHKHYKVIGGYFPGLTTQEYHNATGEPWSGLARAYPEIKSELQALLDVEKQQFEDVGKPLGWRTMQIFYKGKPVDGFPHEKCPATMAALGNLRLAGETAAFQRQSPGTGLPRHVDPCSWVIGVHLGMTIPDQDKKPESPYIWVAGQKYHWREGEVMVFDPSFEHQTFNPTSDDRIILNIDVFHPELTDLECEALQLVVNLKTELFGSTAEEVHQSRRA